MERIEVTGSIPQARFGHTITFISRGKAILFGGATGDTGRFSITGEAYSFDINTKIWKKIETTGVAPSPRAAHASAAVEVNQIVVYGGAAGGGSLASDDLYLLDLRGSEDTGIWTVIPVVGQTPGRRYGHTITYSKPFLVVFGGNTGQEPVSDCWVLKVEKSPFYWSKIDTSKQECPRVRVYHSASLCTMGSANGMVVIFGGRSNDQSALNDSWGLRRHRDGRWDWVKAPSKGEQPTGRYQHSSAFLGKLLMIIGGRTNNVGEHLGMEIYDTETSEWAKFNSLQRFRHSSWIIDNFVYVYGGFELDSPNIPTDQITRLNLLKCFVGNSDIANKVIQAVRLTSPSTGSQFELNSNPTSTIGDQNSTMNSNNNGFQNSRIGTGSQNSSFSGGSPYSPVMGSQNIISGMNSNNISPTASMNQNTMGINAGQTLNNNNITNKFVPNNKQTTFVGGATNPIRPPRQFEFLDPLQAEDTKNDVKKKGTKGSSYPGTNNNNSKISQGVAYDPNSIHNIMIQHLLQPKSYINFPENAAFKFAPEYIIQLCDLAEEVIRNQPMVLRVRAPLKIFGDIHGQYSDLMRFFDLWGSPFENGKDGDIESFDYLFLGDFVDRGSHSLETICLLLALKVRYPNQIHLIRGNHEDKWINNGFGFSDECNVRLGEDYCDENSVFSRVNRLFEWLPLATVIEDKIICLHGGIGSSLHYISEIENLQRPLEVIHEVSTPEQQLVVDILWSDPTESDQELGILPNCIRDPAGTGNIVKFGPDRVAQFLQQNNLSMIIRAHECVMDGFERFAGGKLITVFSATDYCGRHKNAGAVLILRNNFEIIPKLIYPSDTAQQQHNWIEDEDSLKRRPPTPPRWVSNNQTRKSFD